MEGLWYWFRKYGWCAVYGLYSEAAPRDDLEQRACGTTVETSDNDEHDNERPSRAVVEKAEDVPSGANAQ
jgi:hypothetical protein